MRFMTSYCMRLFRYILREDAGGVPSAPPAYVHRRLYLKAVRQSSLSAKHSMAINQTFYTKKRAARALPFSVSLLIAVAAGAVLAVAGVAHVDLFELAHHTVTVELTFGDATGDAAVRKLFHILLLEYIIPLFAEIIQRELTNRTRECTIKRKRCSS